jgi:hypothetical protein
VRPIGNAEMRWYSNWTTWYESWDPRRETTGDQAFELQRIRLGAEATRGERWRVRLAIETLPEDAADLPDRYVPPDAADDATDEPFEDEDAGERWRTYPQAASLRYSPVAAFAIEAGAIDTGYITHVNEAWRFRFIEKTAYELWSYRRAPLRFGRVVTEDAVERRLVSAPRGGAYETDLGVSAGGRFPSAYGNWRLGFYNGEGAAEPEDGGGKAVDARLTVHPFAPVDRLEGMSLTAFAHGEKLDPDAEETLLRYAGLLHYRLATRRGRDVALGFEFVNSEYRPSGGAGDDETIRSTIFSLFFDVEVAEGVFVVGRHDHFDPDRKNGADDTGYKDERAMFLLGAAYEPVRHVKAAFDLRLISHRAEALNPSGDNRIPKPEIFPFLQLGLEF